MSSSATRYIVVGMPRTGTTVTHNCLRGHPSVSAFQEEVKAEPFLSSGIATFTHDHPKGKQGLSELFDAMTSIQSVSDPKARVIKITTGSKSVASKFVEVVQSCLPDVKIIHVNRDDIVARFGSWVKSRKTESWRRRVTDTRKHETLEIELDRYNFADYAVRSYIVRNILHQLQDTNEVFDLKYEDTILGGEIAKYTPIFEFVGVEPMDADWLSDRKLSPPPESYIKNYRELHALRKEIWNKLENGVDPEALRAKYTPPYSRVLWQKAKFWTQRPGYAIYRMEKTFKSEN